MDRDSGRSRGFGLVLAVWNVWIMDWEQLNPYVVGLLISVAAYCYHNPSKSSLPTSPFCATNYLEL